jgi:hypothetical protein
MAQWRSRDVVAVIFALTVPILILSALMLRFTGNSMTLEGMTTFKEIMLVVTGGLIMWLGGGKDKQ